MKHSYRTVIYRQLDKVPLKFCQEPAVKCSKCYSTGTLINNCRENKQLAHNLPIFFLLWYSTTTKGFKLFVFGVSDSDNDVK